MSSVPKRLLAALDRRDGHQCAYTGLESDTLVPHHRGNRGMGGGKHEIANLVWLDSLLNGRVENDLQSEARRRGIKISKWDDPSTTVIDHAVHGLVYLTEDGGVRVADE